MVDTKLPSETAFVVGLDLFVQRLINDAAEMWRTGDITATALQALISDYTQLRTEIRSRRTGIEK
jgi:hypothetical protein